MGTDSQRHELQAQSLQSARQTYRATFSILTSTFVVYSVNTVVRKHPKATAVNAEKANANTALALARIVFIVCLQRSHTAVEEKNQHAEKRASQWMLSQLVETRRFSHPQTDRTRKSSRRQPVIHFHTQLSCTGTRDDRQLPSRSTSGLMIFDFVGSVAIFLHCAMGKCDRADATLLRSSVIMHP